MKVISLYLPQFHKVKENDEWWGEGYTDWVSSKNAHPLYENHYQPHIPLNNNYYDLTDKNALAWQATLMHKYGIDAQCFYHYWFKDGYKILEKPAEILLESKEINMPFLFSWANQSWASSWSAVKNANIWCDSRETKKNRDSSNGLLLEQQYGTEKDWKAHFDYLLPFFKDSRYIKYENKPVFVIYQAIFMDVLPEMSACWNIWAKEAGFDGIYFIGCSNKDKSLVNNVLYPGPQLVLPYFTANKTNSEKIKIFQYKDVCDATISEAMKISDGSVAAFTGYDDSPRRGSKGVVLENATPELFQNLLTKLMAINNLNNQPFTFINAWNEWGEGMHLEPDEKWGMRFLEAVYYAKNNYKQVLFVPTNKNFETLKDVALNEKNKRYESYWRLMDKMLCIREQSKNIGNYLKNRGNKAIIIYGLGMIGKHLIEDLEASGIKILFGIDKRELKPNEVNFPVKTIDRLESTETLIIITACYDFSNIRNMLVEKKCSNIISLELLLNKVLEKN